MIEEKAAVQRLDYSKPPPGYEIHSDWFNDGDSPDAAGVGGCLPTEYWQQWQWVSQSEDHCGDWFGEGDEAKEDGPVAALADAWVDYKAHNDPPGMWTLYWESEAQVPQGFAWGYFAEARRGNDLTQAAARAAAWAWYDRRLAAYGWAGPGDPLDPWPHCLTWCDEQVAEVERWLVDSTAKMPEVLRG